MGRSRRGHVMFKSQGFNSPDPVELTVCPVHLRFVPCRRCKPGEEKYSTDPADVERAVKFHSKSS